MDLFAGCGGLTAGFLATGRYRPVAAVELDRHAASTYAANFGEHIHVGDIRLWVRGALPAADVVVGGPPCQGFSALGRRDPDDPRSQLWDEYVQVLARVRPAFFVIENVPQFLKSPQYASLVDEVSGRGRLRDWAIETHVINAADYGTPQNRRRAVVIGRRKGMRPLGLPTPVMTLNTVRDAWRGVDPTVTDVDLPQSTVDICGESVPGRFKLTQLHVTRQPTANSLARFRAIPPGGNRFDLPHDLKTPGWRKHVTGAGDVMGRLRWDKPSVTIRTEFYKPEKGRYLHPVLDRPITHYEAALLQGFPEDFEFCGNKTSIARQIGNAVPVPLATALAEHLSRYL